jgi:hypothetical protein
VGLRACIVKEDQPPLPVDRQRASSEKMVEPDHQRLEPLVGPEPIYAIAILLAEDEVSGPWVHREAPERHLAGLAREGDHDPGHSRGVHW